MLKNIKVDILLKLPEGQFKRYFEVLQYMQSNDTIGNYKAKEITEVQYGQVKYMQKSIDTPEGLKLSFKWLYGIEDMEKLTAIEFFRGVNHIKEQLKSIEEMEQTAFSGDDVDPKLKEAGIDKLSIFAEMNTLIQLGKEFNKSPEEIETWKYEQVFTIMYHMKISNEVMRDYQKIVTR